MFHIFLTYNNLNIDNIPILDRDRIIYEFSIMIMHIHHQKDNLYLDEKCYSTPYSYGLFFQKFLYADWNTFQHNKSLKNVSQNTYQLWHNCALEHPSLGTYISHDSWQKMNATKTEGGFKRPFIPTGSSFIYNWTKWIDWKSMYYRNNQKEVKHTVGKTIYLPHLHYSNLYLVGFILSNKQVTLSKKERNLLQSFERDTKGTKIDEVIEAINTIFYERILKHKGQGEKEALIREIGTRICNINAYKGDNSLNKINRTQCSLRSIFSLKNTFGTFYISLDYAHGMLEFLDYRGVHLGEYRFTGQQNSPADKQGGHNIKLTK